MYRVNQYNIEHEFVRSKEFDNLADAIAYGNQLSLSVGFRARLDNQYRRITDSFHNNTIEIEEI